MNFAIRAHSNTPNICVFHMDLNFCAKWFGDMTITHWTWFNIEPHLDQKTSTSCFQVTRQCRPKLTVIFIGWERWISRKMMPGRHIPMKWCRATVSQRSTTRKRQILLRQSQPRQSQRHVSSSLRQLRTDLWTENDLWSLPTTSQLILWIKKNKKSESIEVNQCWHYSNYIHLYETSLPVN